MDPDFVRNPIRKRNIEAILAGIAIPAPQAIPFVTDEKGDESHRQPVEFGGSSRLLRSATMSKDIRQICGPANVQTETRPRKTKRSPYRNLP